MVIDGASRTASSPSRADLRRTEGLAASLLRDRAEVLRWKDENPLRLVAAALVDMRRPAKRADIREKLAPEIISPDEWDRWWSRIQPTMKESRHFSQDKRHAIRLRAANPSEIEPAIRSEPVAASPKAQDDKPRAAPSRSPALRLVDWINWAQSDEDASAPPLAPPDGLAAYLRQQPAVLVPTTVARLSRAIDEKILSVTQSSRPSPEAWIDLLAISLDRCADLPADRRAPMAETVGFCARLTDELGTNVCKKVTESLAKWASANSENVSDMADAILINSRQTPRETGTLLQQLHDSLGGSARKALWTRLVTSDVGQVSDWLIGRWMRIMRDAEKSDMVSALILSSSDGDYVAHLNSLLNGERDLARNGDAPTHLFNPILMSWFLHRDMMPRIVQAQRERIQELREENERLRSEHRREITEKDRLIGDAESELERAGSLEVYLRGELRKAVNIAALSFTRDAILILGETLQDLSISSLVSHQEMRDAKAGIALALLTLGAKPFGETGETVRFDSSMHKADPPPVSGTPVTVKAPGVAYFKNLDTPQAMVKMKVKVEERT